MTAQACYMKEYSKKRSAKARPVDVAGGVTVKRSSNARKAQAAPVNTVPTTHALTAAAALPYAHNQMSVTPMGATPMTVTHHQLQQGAVPQLLPTFGTSSGSSAGGTFSAVAANAAAGLRAGDLVHHSGVPQHQHHHSDNDNDNNSDAESLEQLPENTVMCGHPSRPHYKTGLCQVKPHTAHHHTYKCY
eukprot:11983-Heterococcus_DN1.PRE.2